MDNFKTDQELINEARTVATVHSYFLKDTDPQVAKLIALLTDLTDKLESKIRVAEVYKNLQQTGREVYKNQRHQYTSYPQTPAVTKYELGKLENRLKEKIDENWHELKDRIDSIEDTIVNRPVVEQRRTVATKVCETCKHEDVSPLDMPCHGCHSFSKWEEKENE